MASDGQSVQIPATSLVHGSQAPAVKYPASGKTVPQSGNGAAVAVLPASNKAATAAVAAASANAAENAKAVTRPKPELQAQVAVLNKYLNDSGRPAQFRPSQDEKSIQEINPATGAVIAEYSATEFAALARSVGISGAVVNERV